MSSSQPKLHSETLSQTKQNKTATTKKDPFGLGVLLVSCIVHLTWGMLAMWLIGLSGSFIKQVL